MSAEEGRSDKKYPNLGKEVKMMTVYFGLWKLNVSIPPPPTPEDQVRQIEGQLALMKGQLQAGLLKEVHAFLEGDRGYLVTGDVGEEQLYEALQMWSPFVSFELHRTVPFPKALELAVSATKKRTGGN